MLKYFKSCWCESEKKDAALKDKAASKGFAWLHYAIFRILLFERISFFVWVSSIR